MNSNIKILLGLAVIAAAFLLAYKNFRSPPSAFETEYRRDGATIPGAYSGKADSKTNLNNKSNDTVPSSIKFLDLSSEEQNSISNKIEQQDLNEIFQQFLNAGRIEKDEGKQSMLGTTLSNKFASGLSNPDFDKKIRVFILDKGNTQTERCFMLEAYSRIRTKASLDTLLWAVFEQPDDELKGVALGILEYFDDKSTSGDDKSTSDFLLPMLKPHWLKSDDPEFLKSAALAMATQGRTEGIQLLISAATAEDGQDDIRRNAAMWALPKVLSDDSVPYLEGLLMNEKPGSKLHTAAFQVLSAICSLESSQAFMKWAESADDSGLELVTEWSHSLRGTEQIAVAAEAIKSGAVFRSEKNKEMIRAGVEATMARRRNPSGDE